MASINKRNDYSILNIGKNGSLFQIIIILLGYFIVMMSYQTAFILGVLIASPKGNY